MRNVIKKVVIYSLVGILQFGLFAGLAEASPRQERQHQRYEQNDRQHKEQQRLQEQHRLHEQRERERRYREENERHEREMQRRHYESEWAWRERQHHEYERHDQALRDIGAVVLLFLLLNGQ